MELQWELIIFTTLVAWSAGLFASQCVLAIKGEAAKAQIPAWIISAVLLVVGGIAVFFHLEHWDRIFNGFGHLSSGITQELIAIVVLAAVAIVYLVMLRKGEGKPPVWISAAGIAAAFILVVVMAHSYMMAARPAWNSLAWILAILGNACVLGPATMAAVVAATGKEAENFKLLELLNIAGAAVNVVGTIAYVAAATAASSLFSTVGYYFDPVRSTELMADVTALSPFAGDSVMLTVIAVACAAIALALAFAGKKKGNWLVVGGMAAAIALVGAVCLRMLFYNMGASIFLLF